jgi:hypothetical protein
MDTPTATPSSEIDPRFAWRSLSSIAGTADPLTSQIAELTSNVAELLTAIGAADASASVRATPVKERIDTARALSAAAAHLAHAAQVLQVQAAGLVDREGVAINDHERSTRRWLVRHNGITFHHASALCRTATARERFLQVAAAHDNGHITLGHVDAIANIIPARFNGEKLDAAIEAVADIQPTLIETAREHSVEAFAGFCEKVRRRLDPDGTPDRATEPSRVWLTETVHGRWILKGDLCADDGALLATILMDKMARNHRANKNAPNTEPPADAEPNTTTPADTAAPASGIAAAAAAAKTTAPTPCPSEQRARALSELAHDGISATSPGRVGLYVHIDLDHLNPGPLPSLAEAMTDTTAPHTEAALDITADTLWSLLAGADVTPIFTRTGRTLAYGRTHRLPPPILRRILAHRDRICRVPGCDQPAIRNQAHHIIHWDDDGETDPTTCCGACTFHHHDHHDHGLGIQGDAEGELTFTNPDGTPFTAEPAYRRIERESRCHGDPPEPGASTAA